MEGPDAVGAILRAARGLRSRGERLGNRDPAERISEYEPAWLDEQCLAGRFVWTRLAAAARESASAAPRRCAQRPSCCSRAATCALWSALSGAPDAGAAVGAPRSASRGTSRATAPPSSMSSAHGSGLLPTQAEEALAELVALGLVNSDSFAGLRALLVPADRRRRGRRGGRRRRRIALFGMDAAGRWALIARRRAEGAARSHSASEDEQLEHVVRTLLRRWGVVFWRLLAREARLAAAVARPAHVLPAAGSARGDPRRALRRRLQRRAVRGARGDRAAARRAAQAARQAHVSLSGADPLNLVGIVTPGRAAARARAATACSIATGCRSRCSPVAR